MKDVFEGKRRGRVCHFTAKTACLGHRPAGRSKGYARPENRTLVVTNANPVSSSVCYVIKKDLATVELHLEHLECDWQPTTPGAYRGFGYVVENSE